MKKIKVILQDENRFNLFDAKRRKRLKQCEYKVEIIKKTKKDRKLEKKAVQ